mmetsp:Transcript_110908/g.312649  ORF Transcript_110908/g.312649 Transcript_110908/m.312649 type:complete len:306 (+) Transcript_110908:433-1350(+)
MSALHEARHVSHVDGVVIHELRASNVRGDGCERIRRDLRAGAAHSTQERGFTRVRHADEPNVRDRLHLQLYVTRLPRQALRGLVGRMHGVAAPSAAARGRNDARARLVEIRKHWSPSELVEFHWVRIAVAAWRGRLFTRRSQELAHDDATRHPDHRVRAARPIDAALPSNSARIGVDRAYQVREAVVRIRRLHDDVATLAAAPAAGIARPDHLVFLVLRVLAAAFASIATGDEQTPPVHQVLRIRHALAAIHEGRRRTQQASKRAPAPVSWHRSHEGRPTHAGASASLDVCGDLHRGASPPLWHH